MIFILGGRGLVGSAFARYCDGMARPYRVIHRQNYDSHRGQSCDLLINADGNSNKRLAKHNPLEDFEATVSTVRASLDDFRFDRYVYISSCDVYPNCSSPQATSEDSTQDPARQSPYGFHKSLAEQCVRHAAAEWLIFRCGGFVGPGLKKNPIYDILQGGPLYLDPASELQFLHTDRCAEIILRCTDGGLQGEIFNLCGRGVVRLLDVVDWAGKPLAAEPGSPIVRYDVDIQKLSAVAEIPPTRETVQAFVQEQITSGHAARHHEYS